MNADQPAPIGRHDWNPLDLRGFSTNFGRVRGECRWLRVIQIYPQDGRDLDRLFGCVLCIAGLGYLAHANMDAGISSLLPYLKGPVKLCLHLELA